MCASQQEEEEEKAAYAFTDTSLNMWLIKKAFDDKRVTTGLLVAWMLTVCTIFYALGAFHMSYMHVGPGNDTEFMGLKIDTWGKWSALAIFSFFNTCINEFISNALDPWFVNSLQDHKTRRIQYSHATCLWIVQIHCMYVHVMGIFSLFLFFSQVDFAIVRLLADWLVTGFSTVWFIQDKVHDPSITSSSSSSAGDALMMQRRNDDENDDEEMNQSSRGPQKEEEEEYEEERDRGKHMRETEEVDIILADMDCQVGSRNNGNSSNAKKAANTVVAAAKSTVKEAVGIAVAAASAAASSSSSSFARLSAYEKCSTDGRPEAVSTHVQGGQQLVSGKNPRSGRR